MLTPSRFSLAALALFVGSLPLHAQATFRASVSSPGFASGGAQSGRARALSGDGDVVLFDAGTIVTEQGPVWAGAKVLRRLEVGLTELATPTLLGGVPTGYVASEMALSADGRYLAFLAHDAEFIASSAPAFHALVRDTVTGTYERVSEGVNGASPGALSEISISADGNVVAFPTAFPLLATDVNNDYDLYVRDRSSGVLEVITLSPQGLPAVYPSSPFPTPAVTEVDISTDGRFVSFSSSASNLVVGDIPGTWDIYCRDRLNGTTELINVDMTGGPSAYGSMESALSSDGRFVAFSDPSPNVIPGVVSTANQVYLRDRALQQTELISVGLGGAAANGYCRRPSLSSDGRYVAFLSDASNLVAVDTNNATDLFVRDRQLGLTTRAAVSSDGTKIARAFGYGGISSNGMRIAFSSPDTGIVPGDAGGSGGVFVRDLAVAAAPMASYCVAKPFSGGCVAALSVTGIPDTSGATAFQVSATGLFGSVSGLNSSRMSALAWSFGAPPPPYSPGSLCVAAPVRLLPRRLTGFHVGSCGGWYAETISPALMASLGWTPGTTIYTQLYVREPAASSYALSQGVSFVVR